MLKKTTAWVATILLAGVCLTAWLYFRPMENLNTAYLHNMQAQFANNSHPAGSEHIDSFSRVGNLSAHRQIFAVEGDYCDFIVMELRTYSGEPQEIYDFYQAVQRGESWAQDFHLGMMFVQTNQARVFEPHHTGVVNHGYGEIFVLDYLNHRYLWRYPTGLRANDPYLYFIYLLRTNVPVEQGC